MSDIRAIEEKTKRELDEVSAVHSFMLQRMHTNSFIHFQNAPL